MGETEISSNGLEEVVSEMRLTRSKINGGNGSRNTRLIQVHKILQTKLYEHLDRVHEQCEDSSKAKLELAAKLGSMQTTYSEGSEEYLKFQHAIDTCFRKAKEYSKLTTMGRPDLLAEITALRAGYQENSGEHRTLEALGDLLIYESTLTSGGNIMSIFKLMSKKGVPLSFRDLDRAKERYEPRRRDILVELGLSR